MSDRTDLWSAKALANVVLEDQGVRLRAITLEDRDDFLRIVLDPEIWTYFVSVVRSESELDTFIAQAVNDTRAGTRIVFAVVDTSTGAIVGSMAFGNLVEKDRRIEIGWSWLGASYRGTGINRVAKRLLLEHAFEQLQCERVEFKTDVLNIRARRGLTGIGAFEEGVLRSFNYMPCGRRRDAVYYSILRNEWSGVRDGLLRGAT